MQPSELGWCLPTFPKGETSCCSFATLSPILSFSWSTILNTIIIPNSLSLQVYVSITGREDNTDLGGRSSSSSTIASFGPLSATAVIVTSRWTAHVAKNEAIMACSFVICHLCHHHLLLPAAATLSRASLVSSTWLKSSCPGRLKNMYSGSDFESARSFQNGRQLLTKYRD